MVKQTLLLRSQSYEEKAGMSLDAYDLCDDVRIDPVVFVSEHVLGGQEVCGGLVGGDRTYGRLSQLHQRGSGRGVGLSQGMGSCEGRDQRS